MLARDIIKYCIRIDVYRNIHVLIQIHVQIHVNMSKKNFFLLSFTEYFILPSFLALESKLQELMNVCKTGLQEASEIQNEVISAVKKHAQALHTAMDDKTDVSMMVNILLINNHFLTHDRDCTGRRCWMTHVHSHLLKLQIFLRTGSATILPFFLLINLILYLHQDVYMYSDTGTNRIFVAFIGKFRDNSEVAMTSPLDSCL